MAHPYHQQQHDQAMRTAIIPPTSHPPTQAHDNGTKDNSKMHPAAKKQTDFPISNTTAILAFTNLTHPQALPSFFPHSQINHALTTTFNTITAPELKATQRILDTYTFRQALQPSNPNPALIKLDVRSLPTNPLTIISAILAHTISTSTPSPVLASFCNRNLNLNTSTTTPSALQITTTLTTQLLLYLSTRHPKIDLAATMLQAPSGATFRSTEHLNDTIEVLGTLLLSLPQGETIFFIVDSVGQLDVDSEWDLVLALVRVIGLTKHHVSVKVVVTGTRGELSEWLDGYFKGDESYVSISTAVGHSFKGARVDLGDAFETVKGWMVG